MKKKDIINKIRMTAINEIPDVIGKIDLNKINIEEKPAKIKTYFNFKRALTYTMSAFIVVLSAFVFYNFVYIPNTPDMTPLDGESEIIGFQTVSAASMLDSSIINPLSFEEPLDNTVITLSDVTTTESSASATDVEDQMNIINDYLNMMETVLGDQDKQVYQSFASDKPDYAYAIEFKSMDLSGNLIQYRIYYNRTLVDNQYNIEGIMENNDFSFNFSGSMDKQYYRTKTDFKAYIDDENYVQVMNVSTNANQIFNYKVVKDNKVYNESTVSLQSLKYSLQATIQTKNNGEDVRLTITRGKDADNKEQFSVQYNIKDNISERNGLFQVGLQKDQETGKYVYAYRFDNDNVTTKPRNSKGNKPATDDDFKGNGYSENQANNSSDTNGPTTNEKGPFASRQSSLLIGVENYML